ncbi:MAG: cyclic nucleotide-binding domain-containing protein [bacterium]
MMQREAQALIQQYLREHFGRLLQCREFSTVRRAAGIIWRGDVVCPSTDGEIPMGWMSVDEEGHFVEKITTDDVIKSLKEFVPVHLQDQDAALPLNEETEALVAEFADFLAEDDAQEEDEGLGFLMEDTHDEIRAKIDRLLEQGTPQSKAKALELLPRMLTEVETRGAVLAEMAELEADLDDRDMALGYLEAACREFADRSNIEGLERVAALALKLTGEEAYQASSVRRMLTEIKSLIVPVSDFYSLPYFTGLDHARRGLLQMGVKRLTLAPGDDLVREGDKAEHAYVIESGQFSVILEAPDGSSRAVRCIFPGELVGEAAVLDGGGGNRTATIRADRVSSVWEISGGVLRGLVADDPTLLQTIEQARNLRRLHSFFSMHETMGQLDVQVRDELLSCIVGIVHHPAGQLLIDVEVIPDRAYLVAEGGVDYVIDNAVARHYPPDSFAGLRDSIMAIATVGRFVVSEDSTLVEFNGEKLRALAADATPAVVAVLERLE